jgi:hypothetical protein
MIALLNAVVGALLGALVDNRLGAWAQLLTHGCQSRQPGAQTSHATWGIGAVHGMHAMHSLGIPRSVGCMRSAVSHCPIELTSSQLEVVNW